MGRAYFEEVQLLRQTRWVWFILVPFSLLSLLPLMGGVYWQFIKGVPWGNEPMRDEGLVIFCCFILLTWSMTTWVLLTLRLEVYVDAEGIHYKFFPHKRRWNLIRKGDIASFEISRKRNFLEVGGFGHHRNLFSKTRSMVISGPLYIRLVLANQHKLLIGTQNPEGFERAIRRLMSTGLNI